ATPNPPAIPVCSYQYQLLAKIPAPPEKTAQTPPRASEQSTLYQYVWDTVHKRILATVKECPSNAADEKSLGSGNLARTKRDMSLNSFPAIFRDRRATPLDSPIAQPRG
ncbi:unnamed protein product, partial [Fusarium graminearum]